MVLGGSAGLVICGVVTAQDGVTVRVVPGSLLGVRENLVGGLDLGELLRSSFNVAIVPVRV